MEVIAFILAALALWFTHSKQKQIDALTRRLHRLEQNAGTYRAAAGAGIWRRLPPSHGFHPCTGSLSQS